MKRTPTLDNEVTASVHDLSELVSLKSYKFLDLLPVAVYVCDQAGAITSYNKKAVQLWGSHPKKNQLAEDFFASFKFYNSDGKPIPFAETPAAGCLQSRVAADDFQLTIVDKNGSKKVIKGAAHLIENKEGKWCGSLHTLIDITDQKNTELALKKSEWKYKELAASLEKKIEENTAHLTSKNEELKETEERYHKMVEEVEDYAIILLDKNGIIQNWNKGAENIKGYKEKEIVGKSFQQFYRPEDREKGIPMQLLHVAEQNGKAVHEGWRMKKDGTLFWASTVLTALHGKNDEIIGFSKVTRDLTNRKMAEDKLKEYNRQLEQKTEQLKQSEERYHKMIDEVEDYAIILLDKNGIVQNWNKGAENIKGYSENEIVGKSFKTFYLPEDRDAGLPDRLLEVARTTGKAVHEGWRQRKDGTKFWGSIVMTALHNDRNEVIGFTKVTRDLTEKKQAEDTMRNYANQLEFQNKELEQFAYAASHDMKEPLRKIHLYTSTVAENSNNQLDEKSKDYLSRCIAAAKRMSNLIEDLLTYSRITSTEQALEEVDLTELMDEVLFLHKQDLEHQNVSWDVEKLPVITGIPFQLKQLFDNLISNSIKYRHPERNLKINICCEVVTGAEIREEGAERGKNYYKLTIKDNGIGFDQRYAEKMFVIFQRLNNVAQRNGSGIGLAISKKIVQNHQGFIEAEGKANVGASIHIYLPVS